MGRAKLALGRLPAAAARVDLDTFQVPDSKFAREAEDARAEMPPALQGHSYRTWLFGRALADVDGSMEDDRADLTLRMPGVRGIPMQATSARFRAYHSPAKAPDPQGWFSIPSMSRCSTWPVSRRARLGSSAVAMAMAASSRAPMSTWASGRVG